MYRSLFTVWKILAQNAFRTDKWINLSNVFSKAKLDFNQNNVLLVN